MVWGQSLSTLSPRWQATATEIRFRPLSLRGWNLSARSWKLDYEGNRRGARRVSLRTARLDASRDLAWFILADSLSSIHKASMSTPKYRFTVTDPLWMLIIILRPTRLPCAS